MVKRYWYDRLINLQKNKAFKWKLYFLFLYSNTNRFVFALGGIV